MARLLARYKTETAGQHPKSHSIVGEQMAEAAVSSRMPGSALNVTVALVRMFEDGSGIFNFKRGKDDITFMWTPEGEDVFEITGNYNGYEAGVFKPTEVKLSKVSEGN
jgi:hypothetical protein